MTASDKQDPNCETLNYFSENLHQGGPLLLFATAPEVPAQAIRQENETGSVNVERDKSMSFYNLRHGF